MSSTRVWYDGPVFCSSSAVPAAGAPGRSSNKIIGGDMSAKLSGFVELPIDSYGAVMYLRASSIDAFWGRDSRTYVQMRGCPSPDDVCSTSLSTPEVFLLIAAAQDD